ncbi:MAG: translation initiation factor [Verrucomicrobiota bacterium]
MSRPNKNKISTEVQTGGGLFAAFAGLEISGLPEGAQAVEKSPAQNAPAKLGRVVLRRETAHRGGKCVVVVEGFDAALDPAFIEALGKRLRAACGCGGAVKGRALELQGEQVARVRQWLAAEGFRVDGVK